MARSRPHVVLNAAMTLDGKISTFAGDSEISSASDLLRVHRLRSSVDAIMVGINTVIADDPLLSARRAGGRNPTRIIIDSKARIPLDSRIMRTCKKTPTIIACSARAGRSKLEKIRARGATPIVAGRRSVDLSKLLSILKKMKINKLLVEGGGGINWSMLANHLVDEIIITISPRIAGGRDAITLVEGKGFAKISGGTKLRLKKIKNNNGEVVLRYTVTSC